MNWRIITRYIGSTLLLLSSLMAISSIIAYCTPGDNSGMILAYSTLLTAATGIFPLLFEIPGSDIHVDVGFVFIVIIQSSLGNPGLYCDFGKRDIGQVFLLQQRFRCVQDLLFDIIISRCCHYHFSS